MITEAALWEKYQEFLRAQQDSSEALAQMGKCATRSNPLAQKQIQAMLGRAKLTPAEIKVIQDSAIADERLRTAMAKAEAIYQELQKMAQELDDSQGIH